MGAKMAFEIHVWGPGLGLPSIHAQCIAAIAYFQQAVPQGSWSVVASSNPSLSPTKELPALRHGDVWVGGFRNIIRYLDQHSDGAWNLDASLDEEQRADCTAFSAFVASHGPLLVELSLFVSSRNYPVTRSLYSQLQPFPLNYFAPAAIRKSSKHHAERLGLSGLDIDEVDEESQAEHSIVPSILRRKRLTVSSLLATEPEIKAQIKLNNLVTAFVAPLQKLKGKKRYLLLDNEISSLDCEVLGYLSLMICPDLPQPWLKKTFQAKFPGFCDWAAALRESMFGSHAKVENAMLGIDGAEWERTVKAKPSSKILPWTRPPRRTFLDIGLEFSVRLVDSIPLLRYLLRKKHILLQGAGIRSTEPSSTWWPF